MSPFIKNLLVVVVGSAILFGIFVFYKKPFETDQTPLQSTDQVTNPNTKPPVIKPAENKTSLPLKLPDGFSIEVFAKSLSGARVLASDESGNLWVSQTSENKISSISPQGVVALHTEFGTLRKPHGLAFDPSHPDTLYIAQENQITKHEMFLGGKNSKVVDLPCCAGHFTRTLGFGPDGRLYVSIGSSCNVCNESDARRAAIFSMKPDGSDFKNFASGLRNSVFFTWSKDGKLWGTDMGRDNLGDNIPSDEINIIQEGKNYGWPVCFDDNIHDTNFDKNVYIQDPCNDKVKPEVKLQAHSAPLGLGFVPQNSNWPKEYWGDLIVAFHGSWNRSVATGYKLVRVKLDAKGNYEGIEDFITGWQVGNTPAAAAGRPVDVVIRPDGTMFVSDDKAGVIYKITPN